MNARILAWIGTLVILAGAGVVVFRGEEQPAQRRPFPRPTQKRAVHGASESPAVVKPVGLMINAPVHTGEDPALEDNFGVELAFFGTFERTRMALELFYPKGGIIDLDNEASTLSLFEDDRATDLRKEDEHFGPFEMMPRMSEDGRYLAFVVPSDKLPDKNASKLYAKGVVAVRVATRAAEFDAEGVLFDEGTELSLGDFDFEITEAGPSSWGDGHSITLQTDRDTVRIVRYAFVDADGNEHELSPSMSMSGMGTWQQTLESDEELGRGTLRIECWQDMHTVEVPFEAEAGLGLR
ncbi:MAG: hypothetical protein AAF682_20470 [Planctomycetota bacterium]